MPLGLNLLVRLGRQFLAAPLAASGLLPAKFYRHLALAALEEDDFPGVLTYLPHAGDPLLTQLTVLRLRLLAAKHRQERQAVETLARTTAPPPAAAPYHELLARHDQALALLAQYEAQALLLRVQSSKFKV
jgi:hypothetical protein